MQAAEVKSTRELLLKFSSLVLARIGDITKILGNIGYTLGYAQTPLDETDFLVKDCVEDLHDGVRLCRLAEILTKAAPLSLCNVRRLNGSIPVVAPACFTILFSVPENPTARRVPAPEGS